jgi:predicted transcriptional regulator
MPYITSAERIGIEKGLTEGMDKGQLLTAREMVLEALDVKFSSTTPEDIKQQIQALNNRIMLKKLHKSAIQSKDIEDFRKSMKELTAES